MIVRIEAVRAWVRAEARANGCGPLLDATRDPDLPVVLAAIDALGDACKQDLNVTDWLTPELRTPPADRVAPCIARAGRDGEARARPRRDRR